ncbi:MAG: alpha/beta hydrolase [Verrucomicrobiota bacterium]
MNTTDNGPFLLRAASNARAASHAISREASSGRRLGTLSLALVLAGALLPGTGCAAGAQQKGARPQPLAGVHVVKDLEYVAGGHERNRLDLYLPEKAARPLPVILWVHGGGWVGGNKTNGPAFRFATKGYAVASMNYRFSQHAIFPAQIQDCKAAVRWLRANARKYGLDPDRIGAWGASAGGHLVALLGTTAGVKEFEGPGGNEDQSSRVQAVVDWFGPTDFLTVGAKDTRTKLLGGDAQKNRDKAIKASPMTYVSKDAAPFLIMHGDEDQTVPIKQSEIFAAALKQAGADATMVVVKGGKHSGSLFNSPETLKHVEDFFALHLGPPKPAQP